MIALLCQESTNNTAYYRAHNDKAHDHDDHHALYRGQEWLSDLASWQWVFRHGVLLGYDIEIVKVWGCDNEFRVVERQEVVKSVDK